MSKRTGAEGSSSGSDAGGHNENGRNGRDCGLPDPTGPSGPPPGRGRGRGRRIELFRRDESSRGDRSRRPGDRYLSGARGADQPVVVLHDARHLLDDAGTASASANTSSDDRYRLHARGVAGTSSTTDRYPEDPHGDRYRDRGDADRYSPGTGRAPPPRNQGADRQSADDDRAPPTDEPEVPTADRKQRRRRRGGRAYSPRPCRPCGGGRIFESSSGLRRHAATEHHMYFRRPNAYVPIPKEKLEAVLRSIRQGQVHRRSNTKKSAGTRKKKAQVCQVMLTARTPSPVWDLDDTRAPPPAAAASAAAGRPPTPSYAIQEDEGVFFAGQGEVLELPELFQSGRLTPDQVLFDDVDVDRLSTGFGPTRPPMSDSDDDDMGEENPFDLSDLERETDMVIVDMDKRDDWDDRPESPCAAGARDVLLSTSVYARQPTSVPSGWAAAPPPSTISPGALTSSAVAAAGAEGPLESATLGVGGALAPVEHRRESSVEEPTSPMESVIPSDARAHPAPRDFDDVTAPSSERALDPAPRDTDDVAASSSEWAHPAPRDTGHTTSGGGGEEALVTAPMFANTTSGGGARDLVPTSGTVPSGTEAEPYRPMTEPVSPYRAPTPVERPELTL